MKNMFTAVPSRYWKLFFFYYEATISIIVFSAADANYLFKYANVGMQGTTCGGVFLHSAFHNALTGAVLNVPQPSVLTGKKQALSLRASSRRFIPVN